ncbi:hypothetical protein HZC30_02420 [Candidatus Woesearchaeota archaeon]|nr:hypothetical protein [Candidatus Woesearchaeota archaeon]
MGSDDITKKIGDKPTLTSVHTYFSEKDTLDGSLQLVPASNTLDSKLSPEQEQQRYGYYAIKDYCKGIIKESDPSQRNYKALWDSPWHKITLEYEVGRYFLGHRIGKKVKTAQINSTTLETIAAEKKSSPDYQVKMSEEDKGKLRALLDTSLFQLNLPKIKDEDAIFLLRNAYLVLYVTQGKIEEQDAKYLAALAILRNNEKVKQEWVKLRKDYGTGGSAYTHFSLPVIEPLEVGEKKKIEGMKPVEEDKTEETMVMK